MKTEPQFSLEDLARAVAAGRQDKSLRPRQAAEYLDIGLSTLWRWLDKRPDFPRPRKLSPKVTVWSLAELAAWRDSRRN